MSDNELKKERDNKYVVYHNTGFDVPNTNSCLKYVLIGITPGNNQSFKEGEKLEVEFGSINYKFKKAFNGKQMRKNLDNMFKYINEKVHKGLLDELIKSYGSNIDLLFNYTNKSVIDFTSLLKNATYKKTKSGDEKMFNRPKEINEKHKELYESEFLNGFKKDYDEIYSKKDIVYIACGKQVYNFLISKMKIKKEKVIAIVHPSGAAQGCINSFKEGNYNPEELYK